LKAGGHEFEDDYCKQHVVHRCTAEMIQKDAPGIVVAEVDQSCLASSNGGGPWSYAPRCTPSADLHAAVVPVFVHSAGHARRQGPSRPTCLHASIGMHLKAAAVSVSADRSSPELVETRSLTGTAVSHELRMLRHLRRTAENFEIDPMRRSQGSILPNFVANFSFSNIPVNRYVFRTFRSSSYAAKS